MPGKKRSREIFDAVSEKVERAARSMHEDLTKAGINHALIGGIAVGVYGRQRATKDADFLVPSSAIQGGPLSGSYIRGELFGVTVRVGGVNVDLLAPDPDEDFLEDALTKPRMVEGMPVIAPEPLVYLKLTLHRRRDTQDVYDMIQAGLDVTKTRRYLERHASDEIVDEFDALVLEAAHDLEPGDD